MVFERRVGVLRVSFVGEQGQGAYLLHSRFLYVMPSCLFYGFLSDIPGVDQGRLK
jgi:hypothetical protein